ncbi:hypothetical protein CSPAE12_09055 [Colletotrichum incanum]|nr:hypothetical protein CSPAE12_09055 [Colletotrichum incanum]
MAAGSAKLQTPSSEAGGSAADESKAAPSWNNKKLREEFESFKAKLLDQRFDPMHASHLPCLEQPSNGQDQVQLRKWNSLLKHRSTEHFHDPLLPRSSPDPRNNPKGTPEAERRIDQIIAEYKARN